MDDLLVLVKGKSASDPQLRAVRKKVKKGTADFNDTAQYSEALSKLIGKNLSANILDIPPDVREELCTELLEYGYTDINELLNDVQISLDEKNGIHIRPQKAAFPAERVQQYVHSLIDPTVDDSTIKRRAKAGSETITKSFHDDYMKKNAAFRSDAGLKCYIVRTAAYKCCEWCSNIAGRYPYDVWEMPEDIFRRHDNCDCRTILENGRERQDVWTKRTWEVPETGPGAESPAVFTEEQAKAIEQRNLQQFRGVKINNSSIDKSEINDIISLRDDNSLYKPVTQEAIDRVPKLDIFDDDEMNKRHQQAAKDLLTEVKRRNDVPVGTEFSIRYDKDMKPLKDEVYRQGKVGSTKFEDLGEPFHVFHNHGSGETFSLTDIQSFVDINNALSITAVGNNGNNYCLSRLPDNKPNAYGFFLRNKSRTTIYSVNDVNISLAKLSDSIEREKLKPVIEKLSDEQKADLARAIISQIYKCLKGGAKYGFKYTEPS